MFAAVGMNFIHQAQSVLKQAFPGRFGCHYQTALCACSDFAIAVTCFMSVFAGVLVSSTSLG